MSTPIREYRNRLVAKGLARSAVDEIAKILAEIAADLAELASDTEDAIDDLDQRVTALEPSG